MDAECPGTRQNDVGDAMMQRLTIYLVDGASIAFDGEEDKVGRSMDTVIELLRGTSEFVGLVSVETGKKVGMFRRESFIAMDRRVIADGDGGELDDSDEWQRRI